MNFVCEIKLIGPVADPGKGFFGYGRTPSCLKSLYKTAVCSLMLS